MEKKILSVLEVSQICEVEPAFPHFHPERWKKLLKKCANTALHECSSCGGGSGWSGEQTRDAVCTSEPPRPSSPCPLKVHLSTPGRHINNKQCALTNRPPPALSGGLNLLNNTNLYVYLTLWSTSFMQNNNIFRLNRVQETKQHFYKNYNKEKNERKRFTNPQN